MIFLPSSLPTIIFFVILVTRPSSIGFLVPEPVTVAVLWTSITLVPVLSIVPPSGRGAVLAPVIVLAAMVRTVSIAVTVSVMVVSPVTGRRVARVFRRRTRRSVMMIGFYAELASRQYNQCLTAPWGIRRAGRCEDCRF
jgi:hypothetical protein